MFQSHLKKINRSSYYDFKKRIKFHRLDRNERNSLFEKKVIKSLQNKITNFSLQAYPSETKKLKKNISIYENISSKYIELAPGSDGALKYIFEIFSFNNRKLTSIYPTFGMVEIYSKIYRYKFYKIKIQNSKIFNNKIFFRKKVDWIYIANPNQPDGKIIDYKKIKEIIKIAERKKITIVIDEAYIDFSKQASLSKLVKKHKNLVILKTLSKSMGLAGLRIGYIIANPQFIKVFNTVRPIFDISSLSISISEYFFKKIKIKNKFIKEIFKSKKYVQKECKKRNLEFVNTETNFIYIKLPSNKVNKIYKKLVDNKILVRPTFKSMFKNLGSTIRITLGEKKLMEKFFNILDKVKV